RLSRTRTRCPWASRASTRCDPTNPAPPVTSTWSPTQLLSLARPHNNEAVERWSANGSARHVRPHPDHRVEIERVGAEVPIELVYGGEAGCDVVTPAEK